MFPTQKITPCLWFDGNAEKAVNFYLSVFEDSEILHTTRYNEAGPLPAGTVLTIVFRLMGQEYMALNAGSEFHFTEAISLMIRCETQGEIDHYWEKLSDGGEEGPCGWLKDRYGLSWQVAPTIVGEMIRDHESPGAAAMMREMFQMKKLDIARLKAAYEAA